MFQCSGFVRLCVPEGQFVSSGLIGGTTVTIKVAQLRLCNSRMLFARA